ncbi:MAG: hypothetical protein E6I49_12765 [Chloroflexi bacterium]|nr:MAG: hypothetical protein E6I49_12765 [Chloroflexota bacterium]
MSLVLAACGPLGGSPAASQGAAQTARPTPTPTDSWDVPPRHPCRTSVPTISKAAGVPDHHGAQGYEGMDYQASGVTFPAPGCWEVEARAASSVLDFVVYVYSR